MGNPQTGSARPSDMTLPRKAISASLPSSFLRLIVAVAIVAGSLALASLTARPSYACSLSPPLRPEISQLTLDGSGDPQPGFEASWDEALEEGFYTQREPGDVPRVVGAYEVETIYAIDATEGWNRGAVSVVTRTWGSLDGTNLVQVHHAIVDDVDCNRNGKRLGTIQHHLVTDDSNFVIRDSDSDLDAETIPTGLDSLFGDAVDVDRDDDAEQAAIDRILDERATETPPTLVLILVLLALAALIAMGILWVRVRHQRRVV